MLHERARMRASDITLERRLPQVWTVRAGACTRFRVFETKQQALEAVGRAGGPTVEGGRLRRGACAIAGARSARLPRRGACAPGAGPGEMLTRGFTRGASHSRSGFTGWCGLRATRSAARAVACARRRATGATGAARRHDFERVVEVYLDLRPVRLGDRHLIAAVAEVGGHLTGLAGHARDRSSAGFFGVGAGDGFLRVLVRGGARCLARRERGTVRPARRGCGARGRRRRGARRGARGACERRASPARAPRARRSPSAHS